MKLLRRRYQGILRAVTVGISVILQVIFLVLMAEIFKEYSSWVYILLEIFSICLVFALVNTGESYQAFLDYYCSCAAGIRIFAILYVGQKADKLKVS